MAVAVLVGLGAAAALLFAGYVFGAKSGRGVRERLTARALADAQEMRNLREQVVREQDGARGFREDVGKMMDALLRQGDALQRVVGPIVERNEQFEALRSMVQNALGPLLQREQLAFELGTLNDASSTRGELTRLLDEIAEKGHFSAVLLCDDHGLPLAASTDARELERLAATTALMVLMADRIGGSGAPTPLSLMIHDAEDKETLCRIFRVREQRMLLTAVARGRALSPLALDAALPTVDRALTR
jgi:hypothetical protein